MGCGDSKGTQTSSQSQPKEQSKTDNAASSPPGETQDESGHSKHNLVVVIDEVPEGSTKGSTSDLVKCSTDDVEQTAPDDSNHNPSSERKQDSTNVNSDNEMAAVKPQQPTEECETRADSVNPEPTQEETPTKVDDDQQPEVPSNESVNADNQATNNVDNISTHSDEGSPTGIYVGCCGTGVVYGVTDRCFPSFNESLSIFGSCLIHLFHVVFG